MKIIVLMAQIDLYTPIQFLKGVGPKLGSVFESRGIKTVLDLIEFYPRAYEDRRVARTISSLKENDIVSLRAQIFHIASFNMGKTQRKIYEIILQDQTGRIRCKYFRVPYRGYFERFSKGQMVQVIGKVTSYRGQIEFHHPELKEINEQEEAEQKDQLLPIYIEIDGMSSHKISKLIQSALTQIGEIPEKFPKNLLKSQHLITKGEAIKLLHQPPADSGRDYNELKSQAHFRVIFEEFFWLELFLAARKRGFKKANAPVIDNDHHYVRKIILSLPFEQTESQKKCFKEICEDLKSGEPMNRLLQGDVGSGKTLVALMSAALVIQSGYQVSIMVPTEILAEQHFSSAQKYLSELGIRTELLTSKTKVSQRKEILQKLLDKQIDLLIGTHALIEEDVEFANLGLAIIDEQHRFGVNQRGHLKAKGDTQSNKSTPHFLIMTATPIPRTLAMTVYGDLDVSIMSDMPKGRVPIQTRVAYDSKRLQMLEFLGQQIAKGRQAYVIYPLVEESEKVDLKDAVSSFEELKKRFPQYQVGLLHGKMNTEEKEQIMSEFRKNKIQILISTTVIEVGVDVPNANIIVVEHAERFGLSQLHQLRGRVGRGQHKSFCILMLGKAVSLEARQRVQFMEKTSDGFKLAEFDLELRGPGEFLGTRQSGLAGFKMANLVRDQNILEQARQAAFEIIQRDPSLSSTENINLRMELLRSKGPTALADIG